MNLPKFIEDKLLELNYGEKHYIVKAGNPDKLKCNNLIIVPYSQFDMRECCLNINYTHNLSLVKEGGVGKPSVYSFNAYEKTDNNADAYLILKPYWYDDGDAYLVYKF